MGYFRRRLRTARFMSRPMTEAESKAFDKVFEHMENTCAAMDVLFNVVAQQDGSPPPPEGSNEGAKGSNHDG